MQMVVSQAWTRDAGAAADAYIATSAAMDGFLRSQPGFVSRTLVRGVDDPTHFTNLRVFDRVDDYLAMTRHPDYPGYIAALSEHLDLDRYVDGYAREFMDVVLGSGA